MKSPLGINVFEASTERIKYIFDDSSIQKIYVSFSGGKDSTVMLHMVAEEARLRNRRIGVLIVDLEAQYSLTVDNLSSLVAQYRDIIDLYWVCLPIILRNAVSVFNPRWVCWEKESKPIWVRNPPAEAITDSDFFPFFHERMEFEEFIHEFGTWYSGGEKTACFVGIRSDESINRYRTIASRRKLTLNGKQWTTIDRKNSLINVYPIYDWRTSDIWIYHAKTGKSHNRIYDLMQMSGLPISKQRLCQPYGDDQRQGLHLFHVLEPETWTKIVSRVSGANSGAEFVQLRGSVSGIYKISKPDNHTWESFCELLLNTIPETLAEHYRNKIYLFLKWYKTKGYPDGIPDFLDEQIEARRTAPSWRRIAKMILRNDYWGKGLSFTQTQSGDAYQAYINRLKKEREQNGDRLEKASSRK